MMRSDIPHDCIIGLLYRSHYGELATLPYLEKAIKETKEFNEDCKKYNMWSIVQKEYTLKDYADRRKNTNLTRFNFCPECGKKIGWKAIDISRTAPTAGRRWRGEGRCRLKFMLHF